ncbi:hypothetical protein NPIL_44481 [Nephila pilipes]|uniref:Uncharacterized protein n=1 Tax=Nephila pilipes TaxID=299642 RepID=A0A8X6MFE9_NEPPI|nr:hypothetical protein NPIL_44481 [Nephila pilipes]
MGRRRSKKGTKHRVTEGWKNNGAGFMSHPPMERAVKPWGTHGRYTPETCLEKSSFVIPQALRVLQGIKSWAHREKNCPDNVKHVLECLKRFVIVATDESPGINDETEEEVEEEEVTSAEACKCKKFESTPHQMFGSRKERMNEYVGFYDSVFENPDWWRCDDPVEFTETSGLGKDVYRILQCFIRGDLV